MGSKEYLHRLNHFRDRRLADLPDAFLVTHPPNLNYLFSFSVIQPGIPARDDDAAARSIIEALGYGDCFGHSTGHGLGLEIHEYPYISQRSDDILEKGMVFTIEPGIYLPKKFGIRLEETVLVTESGPEVIS